MIKQVFAAFCLSLALVFSGCSSSSSSQSSPLAITTASTAAASVGAPYTLTLSASGGTAPYTWALASGSTLPTGFSFNATAGTLAGTAAANGSYKLSFTVTDSSKPAQSAALALTLTVSTPLTIPAVTLPGATVGVAYSQTLTAAGGTTPYQWSVTSGSLPAGLTLGASTGTISGTPTAAGLATATVTATDAGSPALKATQQISIVVAAPPLAITSTSLPSGIVGTPFSATLGASGGTPPYSWLVATGTLPAGLQLSASTGVLSGTPTAAGTTSFSVKVTDANAQSQTQLLSFFAQPASLTGKALLSGQYFFKVNSFSVHQNVRADHAFFVGSLTFDGNGGVSGYGDYADDNWFAGSSAVTGSYTLGSDNRGTLTLVLPSQGSSQFALAVGAVHVQGGVATRARLVETDKAASANFSPALNYASGFLQLQDPTAFVPGSLTGSSVFGWAGQTDLLTDAYSLTQAGGLSLVGLITVGSDLNLTNASTADIATNQATDLNVPLTGSVAADTTVQPNGGTNFTLYGRATLNLTSTTYPDGVLPAASVIYILDATHAYVVSSPNNTQEPLYSGYLVKQSGSFSAASLTGAAIAYGTSQAVGAQANYSTDPSTLLLYGSSTALVARYNADGAGNLSTTTDLNAGGSISSSLAGSGTYTVAANGRVTFSGSNAPILWLSGTNAGFATTQPTASGPWPALITLEPQTVGTYSNASLSGSYLLGVSQVDAYAAFLASGLIQLNGAGTLAATLDLFVDGGLQQFGSTPITETGTYQIDATGRGTLTPTLLEGTQSVGNNSLVFYIISPTKAVAVDETAGDQSPSVVILER